MKRPAATALLIVASITVASIARAEDLTIGIAAPVTSIDPHFFTAAPNLSLARHIFNQLTDRTAEARLTPGLALSWKLITETIWEFKLRPGVKWHDGSGFTADDVVFTFWRLPRVPNSPGGFAGAIRGITQVEAIDPFTVRFHTAAPSPDLPRILARIAIVSRHVGESAATEDYNSGKAAVGTGAYKLVRYIKGDQIELVRNEEFWGNPPAWEHVTFEFIPNPASRTAALISGDVDIIEFPPPSDLPRMRSDPKVAVVSTQGSRLIYLCPDYSRRNEEPFITDNNGNKLPINPLLDRRVREALSAAIDRESITAHIMQGTSAPSGQWLPLGAFGYAPDVHVPLYNREHAKTLLAEAGYPQGFRLTLHTPNDRYPNGPETALAVAAMWSRIGVQTSVEALPWSAFSARGSHQDFSMALWGWASGTAEAGDVLVNVLGTYDPVLGRGANNQCRYANATLDRMTDRALSTTDVDTREKLEREAVEFAMNDVAIIPLHLLINSWATKKSIVLSPRMDEFTLAMDAVARK